SEPAYLRVKALVNRLDISIDVEGSGSIYVYQLENADAEQLATTLTSVISGIQQPSTTGGGPRGGGRGGPGGQANPSPAPSIETVTGNASFEGPVHVTQDKPTNSLVVV